MQYRKMFVVLIALIVVLTLLNTGWTASSFVKLIPHGNAFSCLACHTSPPQLNAFGKDFSNNKRAWSAALAGKDSDGDGFTNGAELLDPNGTWTVSSPNPGNANLVSNPGDKSSVPAAQAATPTPTATATPLPQPSPTPVISTPTPVPGTGAILQAVMVNEFDKSTLQENGWAEIPGGFDGAAAGSISIETALASKIPSSKDGKGLLFTVKPGQVAFAYSQQPVATGGKPLLLRLTMRATSSGASVALAALRGSIANPVLLDGSIGMNFPKSTKTMVDRVYQLVLLYEPDQGNEIDPVIQVASNSKSETVLVYIDKLEIYSIHPDYAKQFSSIPE